MKRKIGLLLFVFMCVLVLWTITEDYSVDEQLQQAQPVRYIELFMNEFELTAMDENGNPRYRMTGEHLQRYNDSKITEVKLPVLHLLEQGKQWLVSARTGEFNSDNDTITLKTDVIMQQQGTESPVTIHTQRMFINSKTQVARTRAWVDITRGESRIKSKGMIYNNLTSDLQLLSEVQGQHLPL